MKMLQGIRAEVEINQGYTITVRMLRKRGRPRKGQRIAVRQSPRDLAIKLRLDNVITTLGAPYEESDGIKIDALISQGEHNYIRIYRTRIVREIKNILTKPYEKSRLRLGEGGPSYLGTYYLEDKPEDYKTYLEHHKNDLGITESTYDLYLLYITEGLDNFGITAMQTDDTLSFVTAPFSQKEEEELIRKGLRAKLKTIMS
ncbi:hypothetical protein CI238_09906 [Colletotrichum incanum]|uniref:Uncharacterized protein n=1 Tax=Colletotrichum incanum TaxID=1573173 RepID=A0A167DRI6_COLIC|nr:hypothetical protein CI238_09906 [Colletotrichum incanum]